MKQGHMNVKFKKKYTDKGDNIKVCPLHHPSAPQHSKQVAFRLQ
jgi:hypothetical protein